MALTLEIEEHFGAFMSSVDKAFLTRLLYGRELRHFIDVPGEPTSHLAFLAGQESLIKPLLLYITNYNEYQRKQGSARRHTRSTVLKTALQRFLDFELELHPEYFAPTDQAQSGGDS